MHKSWKFTKNCRKELLYRAKLLAIFYGLHVEISHQLTNNQVKWVYSAMVSPGSEKKNNAPQTRSLPAAGLESIVMSPSGVSSQHRFSCIQRGKKSFDSNYYMNFVYWKFHTYIQIDTDLTDVCRKFYGHLNIILSVVGRCANEMAAIHLTKTYCSPILTYGCEAWTLSERSLHTVSVVWNNCFRKDF